MLKYKIAFANCKRHLAQTKNKLHYGVLYQNHDLILSNEDGSPIDPDGLSREFTRLVKRIDIPHVRFHDLRHTHATLLLQQGEHPKVVSERLGHSTIAIAMDTYSHVMRESSLALLSIFMETN